MDYLGHRGRPDLSEDEAARLVGAALADVRARGCLSVIDFDRRYLAPAVLRRNGFFIAPRDVYLSFLVGRERLDGFRARSVYLDWR